MQLISLISKDIFAIKKSACILLLKVLLPLCFWKYEWVILKIINWIVCVAFLLIKKFNLLLHLHRFLEEDGLFCHSIQLLCQEIRQSIRSYTFNWLAKGVLAVILIHYQPVPCCQYSTGDKLTLQSLNLLRSIDGKVQVDLLCESKITIIDYTPRRLQNIISGYS